MTTPETISDRHRRKTAEQRVREQEIRCVERGVDRETDQDERSGLPGDHAVPDRSGPKGHQCKVMSGGGNRKPSET